MRDDERTKDPMKDTWLCSPMIQCQWFAALPVWRRHIEQLLYCSVGCIAHADAGGNRKQTKDSEFHKRHTISHHQRVRMPNLHVSQGTRLIIRLICARALALRLLSTPVLYEAKPTLHGPFKGKKNNHSAKVKQCVSKMHSSRARGHCTETRQLHESGVVCPKHNWTNRVQGIEIETTNFPNRVWCTATPFLKLRDPQKGAAGHCALYQGTVKQPSSLPEGIGQRSTLFGPSM